MSFEAFSDEGGRFPAHLAPNELCVGLVAGRGLSAKHSVGGTFTKKKGSSDPRVSFTVEGHPEVAFSSRAAKKTLDPKWAESWTVPLDGGGPPPVLVGAVSDAGAGAEEDGAMGSFRASLDDFTAKQTRTFALEGGSGSAEVAVWWRHNPDLHFDPFRDLPGVPPGKQPNELRVGVARGRGLGGKESRGASSSKGVFSRSACNPLATLRVVGAGAPERTAAKAKTADPRWHETFTFPLLATDAEAPTLRIDADHHNEFLADKPLGGADVDLAPLRSGGASRGWYPLLLDGQPAGELELALRWGYDASLDFEPFRELGAAYPETALPPNELHVAVVKAADLPARRGGVLSSGGTSAPRIVLDVGGKGTRKTATGAGEFPTYKQVFRVPCRRGRDAPPAVLRVSCEDVLYEDEYGGESSEVNGFAEVDVGASCPSAATRCRRWFDLAAPGDALDGGGAAAAGRVELVLQWVHKIGRAHV